MKNCILLNLLILPFLLQAQVTSTSFSDRIEFSGAGISNFAEYGVFTAYITDGSDYTGMYGSSIEVGAANASPFTFAALQKESLSLFKNGDIETILGEHSLRFRENTSGSMENRMELTKTGMTLTNGASWKALEVSSSGNNSSGLVATFAGGGLGRTASIGASIFNANGGDLSVYSRNLYKGGLRVSSDTDGQRTAFFSTQGDNSNTNFFAGVYGSIYNHGYAYVADANGIPQAGMRVNVDGTGTLFADTKSFRMDHPQKADQEIWYVSLEGPEAAAYERGTAELVNGAAFVPFSDHYRLVINPETMTVQITPLSSETYGLAVIKKTKKGFYVKELGGGQGSFSFDWQVTSVREGYEDFKVIRPKEETAVGVIEAEEVATNLTMENKVTINNPEAFEENSINITEHNADNNFLQQNSPNPFNDQTTIHYQLPQNSPKGNLLISNIEGQLLKSIPLNQSKGKISLLGQGMTTGTYYYAIEVEGKIVANKKMIVIK